MTALCSQQATNRREGRRLRAWELFQEGWPPMPPIDKAIKRLRQKPHIIRACVAQAGLV